MATFDSEQLKTILALYDEDTVHEDFRPNFQKLNNTMTKSLNQEYGVEIFETRNKSIVSGTPAKSRSKGKSPSCEKKQGDCMQWKAIGTCFKGRSLQIPSR